MPKDAPQRTTPDRAAILADLSEAHRRLEAKRKSVTADLTAARHREETLQTRYEEALQRYRATPAGIAESLRSIEAATLNGMDARQLLHLHQRHVAAEDDSYAEYVKRRDRWGHKSGDGPVRGCPAGSGPLAAAAMRDRLLGSYRHDPTCTAVIVRLYVLTGGRRLNATVTVPTADPLTLTHVLGHITSEPKVFERVCRRLHLIPDRYRMAVPPRDQPATG
jgi:hypothetical protein